MADDLGLSVGGTLFEGWQSVSVTRSIEQLADTFTVSYVEDGTETGDFIPIEEGDAVQVKIDSLVVIKGFVDETTRSYTVGSQRASVSGRSVLGDLVDCSARQAGGQWRQSSLKQIAEDLLGPFGLSVVLGDKVSSRVNKKFRRFALQYGETVHELLIRAAKMRGVLMVSDPNGDLVFTQVGEAKVETVLERGVNIKSAELTGSWKDRFSTYRIKAQASGDDSFFGKEAASKIVRNLDDDAITRYRPTDLMAENEDTGQELAERIAWERNTRAGGSRRLNVVVEGWRDNEGELWTPNTLVRLDDNRLDIEDELLIVGVTLNRSLDQGFTTSLELTGKEAFDVLEEPLPKQEPRSKKFFAGVKK